MKRQESLLFFIPVLNSQAMEGLASVLFALPTDVIVKIFVDWIGVKGMVKVDTAMCEHSLRTGFTRLLSSSQYVMDFDHGMKKSDSMIVWASTKNVSVRCLSIGHDSDLQLYESYIQKLGGKINLIRLHSGTQKPTTNLLRAIASHCTQLNQFECRSCVLDASVCDVFRTCTTIESLLLCIYDDITTFTATDLVSIRCLNLRKLELEKSKDASMTAAFVRMAPNVLQLILSECPFRSPEEADNKISSTLKDINPQVTHLSVIYVELRDNELIWLVDHCSHTVRLDISGTEKITLHGLTYAARNLKYLTAVNLSNNDDVNDDYVRTLVSYRGDGLTELQIENTAVTAMAINHAMRTCLHIVKIGISCDDICEKDEHLQVKDWKNLTDLVLIDEGHNVHNHLLCISQHCEAMQHMTCIVRCFDSKHLANLGEVIKSCGELRSVHVTTEFDQSWGAAAEFDSFKRSWKEICPQLKLLFTLL